MVSAIIQLISKALVLLGEYWTKRQIRNDRKERQKETEQVVKETDTIKEEVNKEEPLDDLNARFGWKPGTKL